MTTTPPAKEPAGEAGNNLAELLCALSFMTDVGMGQSMEHGLKTACIALQLTGPLGLPTGDRLAMFYGALVKDAGCTACAALFATFFDGDDMAPRRDCFLLRPGNLMDAVTWFWRHAPEAGVTSRIAGLFSFFTQCQPVLKEGLVAHCEVGEMFARRLGLPEAVQQAVRFSWERWDGKGMAYGLKGHDIPLAARALHLA